MTKTIVFFSGCCFVLMLAVGQFFVRKKNPANLILISLLILCCIWLTHATWYILGLADNYPHLNKTYVPFFCLCGPLWYLYIKCLLDNYQPEVKDLLFLIPSVACFLLSIPFYLQTAEFKINYIEVDLYDFTTVSIYTATRVAEITVIISMIFSLSLLADNRTRAKLQSDLTSVNLLLLITASGQIAAVIRFFGAILNSFLFAVVVPCAIICIAFAFLYCLSHRYPSLLSLGFSTPRNRQKLKSHDQTLQKYRDKIKQEQWYLDPEIKMQRLAERLNTSSHQLSEAINLSTGKNFNRFINDFRVEHAKEILINEPKRTILDVAYSSGFNSKSAFYNYFTQQTSMTPSQFRKNMPELTH